ncbi:MAG: GIY-YIG nuclease family protein [Anaerolineales bacterium]|nr:GIY-YIG nuclease family protein [Anaerolineales bacterium]
MPFVYIVRCKDGTLYTGWSVDVEARVRAHNAGRGARYTKTRRPVKLIYSETVASRGDALRRERAIKRLSRAQKLALAQQGAPRKTNKPSAKASQKKSL